jgi:hypothetical protein
MLGQCVVSFVCLRRGLCATLMQWRNMGPGHPRVSLSRSEVSLYCKIPLLDWIPGILFHYYIL